MPIAGMPDPVKTIELSLDDFPLVLKIAGAEDFLYLGYKMEDDGAALEVSSIWNNGIVFEHDFPIMVL